MRRRADRARIQRLFDTLGRRLRQPHILYLAGGASAVLVGWRDTTIDVVLRPEPDSDDLLRAVAELKDRLDVNIELASPLDFLPELSGWRERSPTVSYHGPVHVRHLDFRLQGLAKLERGFEQDIADVRAMLDQRLVTAAELRDGLDELRGELYRFPAADAQALERRLMAMLTDR
jgi:hypothetical protein